MHFVNTRYIFLIVFFFAAVGAYAAWHLIKPLQNTNITNVSTSSESTVNADWQTYTNSKYGFTVQYPDGYKILADQLLEDSSGKAVQVVFKRGENEYIEIYGETIPNRCYKNLCDIPPKDAKSFNGVSWDSLGSTTYCDAGMGCSSPLATYRTLRAGMYYYVSFSSLEQVAAILPTIALKSPKPLGGMDSYGTPASQYAVDDAHAYFADRIIDNADPKTLEVLKGSLRYMKDYISYLYARDSRAVYYAGIALVGANPARFRPIENGAGVHNYGTDEQKLYFDSELIPGARPESFKVLWENIYEGCRKAAYATDVTHVYFATTTVTGADPATFEALLNDFGKDNHGYYKRSTYIGSDLDPKELVCTYG